MNEIEILNLRLIDAKFAALLALLQPTCSALSKQEDIVREVFNIAAANRSSAKIVPQISPARLYWDLNDIEGSLHQSVKAGQMPDNAKIVRAFCILLSRVAWEVYGSKDKFGQIDPKLHALLHMHEAKPEVTAQPLHPRKAELNAEQHRQEKGIIAHFRGLPQIGLAPEDSLPQLREDLGDFGKRLDIDRVSRMILTSRFEQLSKAAAQPSPPTSSAVIISRSNRATQPVK